MLYARTFFRCLCSLLWAGLLLSSPSPMADKEDWTVSAHWDGTAETEELIKKETKATIRCIPLNSDTTPGTCIRTGNPSARRVLFARAY